MNGLSSFGFFVGVVYGWMGLCALGHGYWGMVGDSTFLVGDAMLYCQFYVINLMGNFNRSIILREWIMEMVKSLALPKIIKSRCIKVWTLYILPYG